jgi:hypothetical protein
LGKKHNSSIFDERLWQCSGSLKIAHKVNDGIGEVEQPIILCCCEHVGEIKIGYHEWFWTPYKSKKSRVFKKVCIDYEGSRLMGENTLHHP